MTADSISPVAEEVEDICANFSPIIKGEGVQSEIAFVNFFYQLTFPEFCDQEDTDFEYKLTKGDGSPIPSWMSFNSTTRMVTGIPLLTDTGVVSFEYSAKDSGGLIGTEIFNILVNSKPIVNKEIPS